MAADNNNNDPHLIEALVAIGRIEGKLDALGIQQTRLGETQDKLETRVGSLEQSRAWMLGLGAAAGALSSAFVDMVIKKG